MLDGQRIAIVLLSAIGDMVHAFPLVASLKAAAPRARIEWIVQPVPSQLARHHPGVDRVWLFERARGWRAYQNLRRALQGQRFDLAIDLQVYAKASLITAMLDAERKLGFDRARARELNWVVTTERLPAHPPSHVLDQYMEFADYLGAPRRYEWPLFLTPDEREAQGRFLAGLAAPMAALVVGTSKPAKDWPPERWARLAEGLHDAWGYEVVLVGGPAPAERAAAAEVVRRARCPVRDELRQSVRELLWLLDGSAVVVSPDTGPYHMAVALGVPAVGLYAYLDPARVGPSHRVLELVVDAWREPGERWHPPRFHGQRAGRMVRIAVEDILEKVALARARYARAVEGPMGVERP